MRAARSPLLVLGLLVLWPTFAWNVHAQVAPCEASPKVREALRALPQSTGDARADRAARLAAVKGLLQRHPNDLFVHSAYQDEAMAPPFGEREAVIADYRALAARHPNDTVYRYLSARALVGTGTKELIPQLEEMAGRMPPARLLLVRIYQSPSFRDSKKAREHVEAFIAACPSALAAYEYARAIEPGEFLTRRTITLRRLLAARTDAEAVSYYGTLWGLEFRVTPPAAHDTVRRTIAADLKRLRALPPQRRNVGYYSTMRGGYKLVGDGEGEKWAAREICTRSPRGYQAYESLTDDWYKNNAYPKDTDPPEKRAAYYDAYVEASSEWVHELPENTELWLGRVAALRESRQGSAADVEVAGERLLQIYAKNPGMVVGPNFPLEVANLYATRGVRLDRLPDLVERAVAELDAPSFFAPSDLFARPAADQQASAEYEQWETWSTISEVWLKAKDQARAREALTHVQTLADRAKPKDPQDPTSAVKQRDYLKRQETYWREMGDLARLEGRKIDAITFYQNSMFARPAGQSASQPDEVGDRIRVLWKETGGSDEAWQAWSTRRSLFGQPLAEASGDAAWTQMEKALPDFELPDLSGVKWRLADFKGKTTLVGIWATW